MRYKATSIFWKFRKTKLSLLDTVFWICGKTSDVDTDNTEYDTEQGDRSKLWHKLDADETDEEKQEEQACSKHSIVVECVGQNGDIAK